MYRPPCRAPGLFRCPTTWKSGHRYASLPQTDTAPMRQEGQMRDVVSNEEIVQEARKRLEQGAWDYLVGGSESETTLRRNRLAYDKVAFRPRILVDVSTVDPSTTFLGQKLRIPAILAPIGSLQTFDPSGGLASTRAASEFGIMHAVSSVTQPM